MSCDQYTISPPIFQPDSGVLFTKDMSRMITAPRRLTGIYEIPDGVKVIGQYAVYSCDISSLILPASVERIEFLSIIHCQNLKEIVFLGHAPKLNKLDYACQVLTEPTCDAEGLERYTWRTTRYGSFCFEVPLDRENHRYMAPTFQWTEDYACTATFACIRCGDTQTVACTVTSETTPPDVGVDEKTVYTAEVLFNGTVYTDTQTVTIPALSHTPGDINGDGKLNNRDAARLMQYLAGWDVEFVGAALDVNGDGRINNRDAARLMQYLAGWDVEIH